MLHRCLFGGVCLSSAAYILKAPSKEPTTAVHIYMICTVGEDVSLINILANSQEAVIDRALMTPSWCQHTSHPQYSRRLTASVFYMFLYSFFSPNTPYPIYKRISANNDVQLSHPQATSTASSIRLSWNLVIVIRPHHAH